MNRKERIEKMKTIYLVHCWGGTSKDGWYPWIKEKLLSEYKNINVEMFDMPNTDKPEIKEWVNKLEEKVLNLDENTYFIGHSIGCQSIMRYLENKNIDKIGGILFVTPWLELLPYAINDEESYKIAYPWLNTPINFENIKRITDNITCIFSDNDYFVPLNQIEKFKGLFNAKIVTVKDKGHISMEDNVYKLDEILEEMKLILKLK